MPTVVAHRYARALADVVATIGDYRQVLKELEDFSAAYRESVELREVCETPAVPMAQKLSVLEVLAGRLGVSHITLNFLRVLTGPLSISDSGGDPSGLSERRLRAIGYCAREDHFRRGFVRP